MVKIIISGYISESTECVQVHLSNTTSIVIWYFGWKKSTSRNFLYLWHFIL